LVGVDCNRGLSSVASVHKWIELMMSSGISPNYGGLYAVVFVAIIFAGWLGVLRVAVKFPK
jgi:hypothetical protein